MSIAEPTAAEVTRGESAVNPSSDIQTVAITGATGLVGTSLSSLLSAGGKTVTAISRKEVGSYQDSIRWDPATGLANPGRLEAIDAIVHLAGENIAMGLWTKKRKPEYFCKDPN